MNKDNCKCNHCGKELLVKNIGLEKSKDGLVLKNLKLVFFNNNGEVLVKCKGCKEITTIPLNFNRFFQRISPKKQ